MGSTDSRNIKYKYKEKPNIEKGEGEEEKKGEENIQNNLEQVNNVNSDSKQITVIIPLISGGCWEKTYNIETSLNQIATDFKMENNMNSIQKNHYIEYSFKNNPIDMNNTSLRNLIDEETTTIHIATEIKSIPGTEKLDVLENIEIVGKPFFEPFQIFTFEIQKKLIKTRNYNPDKIKAKELDKFGINSAYCNGNNHLFISGGVDPTTNENIGLFWDFDLTQNSDFSPIKMFPKKNHSMIYIQKKVYIIGGDDVNTMIYSEDDKEITHWANLNYKRFEPSLIRHDNFLFCFDTSRKYINNFENNINFEKIDLFSRSEDWELVNPQISPNIVNCLFCQKFFGVVEDFRENIIFVGGIYDNDNKENDINKNEFMNLQYNISKNLIEKSDIQFNDISFGEKCFFPIDDKTCFILPNFNRRSPNVVYFYKDKNMIEIKTYHPNSHLKKRLNKIKTTQLKPSFIGLNFDMPISQNDDPSKNQLKEEIILDNLDNLDNSNNNPIIHIENYKLAKEEEFKNNEEDEDEKPGNNFEIKNNNKEEEIKNNVFKNENSKEEDINIKDNNIQNDNTNKNENENVNVNVNDNINTDIKEPEIKISNEEKKQNIEETDILLEKKIKENSSKKDSNIEEEKKNNSQEEEKNIQEGDNQHPENENKDVKQENQNNENISKKEEEIKNNQDINVNQENERATNIKSIIPNQSRNKIKILYIEKPKSLEHFHSSIDNTFNKNNVLINGYKIKKAIKMRNIILPRNISVKSIKKQMRKFNKTEINEFRDNNKF